MASTAGVSEQGLREELRGAALHAVRTLAVISLAGAVSGAIAVGGLGRLAMRLLAYLNPDATGLISDDGFEIGQVTLLGSLQLVGAGVQSGLVGALGYAAFRGLRVGPPWFRLVSVSIGAGVLVGALMVTPHGVDFQVLGPPWLAATLFVAIPTVYVALLSALAEWLLGRGTPSRPVVVAGLLVWVALPQLVPVAVLGLGAAVAVTAARRTGTGARVLGSPVLPWALRFVLAVVLVGAVVNLVGDLQSLT